MQEKRAFRWPLLIKIPGFISNFKIERLLDSGFSSRVLSVGAVNWTQGKTDAGVDSGQGTAHQRNQIARQ